ncbi:SusD/RagB family nutrient-binding outer membrane lipoprotein [Ferruginibacter sp. HRS2-29]|uniref:SusD/RagB family nutrient-binding outer membrane lipoprotein n=1 Tax=Ferruginibacter sp. HRS2-29 TaxID=2487334 RepID=UPI0020CD1368|nr:SusD/RagB family nutrient-binding outer membrane lipoprotein [Ferruginibacter sp. HRS2-29]MCP9753361.1 SusD/RagB family nutrient-binding outer membrane lipoprotein [Ferruginibacter sp. HRS2-29]
MKNYIKIFSALLITGTALVSCTKDFESINKDPNRIDQISPGTLLNPIIYETSNFNMLRSDDITFNLMQVALPYPSASGGLHRYDVSENIGGSTWNTYYRWLTNVKEMYQASVKAGDPNYQAIALTLNAWIYGNLTDCFGDVPMTEASRGDEGLLKPKFNTQKEVYTKVLADLDSANKLFNTSKTMIYGTDILYGNNVTKWKKFCNSLHMRLLLRVSKKTEMNAMAQLRTIIDNPTIYPVFSANSEAAVLTLTGITPLAGTWGRPVDFTSYRAVGKFFLDSLNAFNDPRRARFATQARNAAGSANIGYQGIPSGYTGSENQFNYIPSNVNVAMVTAPHINPILPYSEVELIRAEVELFYNNTTAAQTAYEKGVKASVEQWGAVMPADYFTNPNTAFNNTLSRIHIQKYYALMFVDFQSWFEYRRTGYPVMPVAAGMMNNQKIPSRFYYPISIRNSNTENYHAALESNGPDNINTKVWWAQ